jgi:hypothetical protein
VEARENTRNTGCFHSLPEWFEGVNQ